MIRLNARLIPTPMPLNLLRNFDSFLWRMVVKPLNLI